MQRSATPENPGFSESHSGGLHSPASAGRGPQKAFSTGSLTRPRNYLARDEQRRLFWIVMPPAMVVVLGLAWLERAWFASPPEPAVEQVDTRLFGGGLDSFDTEIPDAVLIEAEQLPPVAAPGELGTTASSLAKVRDDTTFREADDEAWFGLWQTIRSTDPRSFRAFDGRQIGFTELHGQPRSFRGRLVRFAGTVRRVEWIEATANEYNIAGYWQAWVEPQGGPPSPVVVYFQQLPEGFPSGLDLYEPVEVVGYFFKRWAYQATDAIRTAPLLVALEPIPITSDRGPSPMMPLQAVMMSLIFGLVAVTGLALWLANRGRRRSPEPAKDLDSSLAERPLFSAEQALQDLSRQARHEDADASPTDSTEPAP
jgi:hypothetical protein